MKKLLLIVTTVSLVLSLIGVIFSIANCRIFSGMPDDLPDLPDGRVFLYGERPYPYIPTEPLKEPVPTPIEPTPPEDSARAQDDQALNKNESVGRPTETNRGQISELPVPFPDGRIFLGAEDPIPYIPTESPKIISRIPILPAEPVN